VLFMFLVLLVINPIILYQAVCVAVGGVRGAIHVPGAAAPLHMDLPHLGPGTRQHLTL